MVDTSDEWIAQRTGIRQRHIAAPGEATSRYGDGGRAGGARRCRSRRAVDRPHRARDLDARQHLSGDRGRGAGRLGITHGAAFDMQAVCSGFVYRTCHRRRSAENRRLQARAGDRLGDVFAHPRLERPHHLRPVRRRRRRGGAGSAAQPGTREDRGILTAHLRSDGRHKTSSTSTAGPPRRSTVGHLRMEGREVFKHAVA